MKIRAAVVDFGTSRENNFLIKGVHAYREIEDNYEDPDMVFYSCFGAEHLKYHDAVKVFICDENVYPDFNQCDYAIGSVRMECGDRYLWFPPCFSTYLNRELPQLPDLENDMAQRKFCSFIYSQDIIGKGAALRKAFCKALMQYKHVDCPGKILHNMDAPELAKRGDAANWNESKIKFLSRYKFNIAFENSSTPGYITEKLMDAYLANTVPIYFGSEGNVHPFPKESMICANDYPDFESLINKIREIDSDNTAYMNMLAANPLRNNMKIAPQQQLNSFLSKIFAKKEKGYEKDSLKVSDAYRLIRCGGKNKTTIFFKMFVIAMKAAYAQFILKDRILRQELGIAYHQMKEAMRDITTISDIK
ncbi:MAG: hypothetical protein IKA23_04660 [Akkermansia sp.]|nr:hypothetical protein [Akkermansia sp.]